MERTRRYLAADPFRHQVMRPLEALDHLKNAIAGVQFLADVGEESVPPRGLHAGTSVKRLGADQPGEKCARS